MGRAKLDIKYRENLLARRTTYMTRLKGLKKKSMELSLLCGVDVLFVSYSPDSNALEFWPEHPKEFNSIRERYLGQISCNPMPSPSISLPSLPEEKVAIQIKLEEVRERLDFLQHQRQAEEESLQFMVSMPSKQQQDSHPHQRQTLPFSQSLPPHPCADFNTPSQQDFHLQQQPYPFVQDQFSHSTDFSSPFQQDEQPSPLSQSFSHQLAAHLNAEDLPTSLLASKSPLWNHSDDLNWCDSLFLDY